MSGAGEGVVVAVEAMSCDTFLVNASLSGQDYTELIQNWIASTRRSAICN